jgi:hypothetical protein
MVYWPNEKRWFPGRVTSATTSAAVVRYDDGDTSLVEVGDRWVLESPAASGEVSAWTRPLPPGPGVEVVELDGERVEEEEDDGRAAKWSKKSAYVRAPRLHMDAPN